MPTVAMRRDPPCRNRTQTNGKCRGGRSKNGEQRCAESDEQRDAGRVVEVAGREMPRPRPVVRLVGKGGNPARRRRAARSRRRRRSVSRATSPALRALAPSCWRRSRRRRTPPIRADCSRREREYPDPEQPRHALVRRERRDHGPHRERCGEDQLEDVVGRRGSTLDNARGRRDVLRAAHARCPATTSPCAMPRQPGRRIIVHPGAVRP